ncbi:hypothetical protein LINPERHAP1_LOCUS17750 [Linum perenne]
MSSRRLTMLLYLIPPNKLQMVDLRLYTALLPLFPTLLLYMKLPSLRRTPLVLSRSYQTALSLSMQLMALVIDGRGNVTGLLEVYLLSSKIGQILKLNPFLGDSTREPTGLHARLRVGISPKIGFVSCN